MTEKRQHIEKMLDLISDSPQAEVLRYIIEMQEQIRHSQEKVIEAMILMASTDPNNPLRMDFTWIEKYLKNR